MFRRALGAAILLPMAAKADQFGEMQTVYHSAKRSGQTLRTRLAGLSQKGVRRHHQEQSVTTELLQQGDAPVVEQKKEDASDNSVTFEVREEPAQPA